MVQRVFYGWWIVLAVSLIHFWGAGTFFYSFTAFFNPIVDEFGWSYAAVSFAASIRSIESGIASPVVGFAADRYGSRRLLVLGCILSGFGFILLGHIHSIWSFYLLFIFLSIGASLVFPVPGWAAAANWFVAKRGIALGIISAAIGLAGVLIFVVNWLIGMFGWRLTMVIIGIGMWLIGIPASLVVRHRPEDYGLMPDGVVLYRPEPSDTKKSAVDHSAADTKEVSVRQAIKTKLFWLIVLTVTLSGATVHAVSVHIMPYFISVNMNRETASIIAMLLVIVSTVGRFGMGWLAKPGNNRFLLTLALLIQALGLFVLAGTNNFWEALLFVGLFGPGYGGVVTLRLLLQIEFFGRKSFGSIQGLVMGFAIIGTMSFPLLTGWYYDLFGNYRAVWLIMAFLLIAFIPFALKAKSGASAKTKRGHSVIPLSSKK